MHTSLLSYAPAPTARVALPPLYGLPRTFPPGCGGAGSFLSFFAGKGGGISIPTPEEPLLELV